MEDSEINLPEVIPSVVFKMRIQDKWEDVTTFDLFARMRVVIFSLPGAFTPTCSNQQLPDFEELYPEFKDLGIDAIYCISVNDAFVMNAWAKQLGIKNIKMIPDGSAKFTSAMGMDVYKDNFGFGVRSWRYAAIVTNGKIETWFIEPHMDDDVESDPYGETTPQKILRTLFMGETNSELPF
jgi:peroxiredoxin